MRPSRARIFDTRFADELELGHIFSVFRDGREAVEVVEEPERHKNMVGEKSYMVVSVAKVSVPRISGQMILPITSPVFVRVDVPRETSAGT